MQGQHRRGQREKLKVGIAARRRSSGGRRLGLGNEVWKHRSMVSQTWLSVVWKVGWRAPELSSEPPVATDSQGQASHISIWRAEPKSISSPSDIHVHQKKWKGTRQCDTPWQGKS